jgi:DNA repair protein RadC
MAAVRNMTNILDSERFGDDKRRYFIDLKKTRNDKHYLRITRRDEQKENNYKRTQIILFEDDLGFFVEALSMVLGRFSQGQTGVSS